MDAEQLASVTDEGKKQFELLVQSHKENIGIDWDNYAELVRNKSGVQVSKDVLYRTTVGMYKKAEPPFSVLLALSRVKDLVFIGTSRHPDANDLMSVLVGEVDACGKPTPTPTPTPTR
jgi:hypothetical protein